MILDTPANWLPFLAFLAKLSTFVVGMVVAQAYLAGRGALFWRPQTALMIGLPIYAIGFVCQFYLVGWIFADLLTPIGLALGCMAIFKWLEGLKTFNPTLSWLGFHSYSYFLIHNFVVDRSINLWVQDDRPRYCLSIPLMIVGTLLLAVAIDFLSPLFKQGLGATWRTVDAALSTRSTPRVWSGSVGDRSSA